MSVSVIKGFSTFFVHGFLLYSRLPTESPSVKAAWHWTNCALSLNTQTLPDTYPSWSVRPPYIKHGFLSLNSYTHKKSHCVHKQHEFLFHPSFRHLLGGTLCRLEMGALFVTTTEKPKAFTFPIGKKSLTIWAGAAQGAGSLTRKSIQPWLATDVKVLTLLTFCRRNYFFNSSTSCI